VKKEILKEPTEPIEVRPDKKISVLVKEMLSTAFQGRKLAEAVEVWSGMLEEKQTVIWLGLAGAMVPAGMRKIIVYLIKRRMIDVIVTTGANMYHDLYEAMGKRHFIGTYLADDIALRKCRVDRIYDVFADEDKFYKLDLWIEKKFCPILKDGYPYSSREVLHLLGQTLYEKPRRRESILAAAYRHGVPIFCPALNDSSLGFSIMFANRREKRNIIINALKDVDESSHITEKAKSSSVIYIGGGVPKNFIQQTAVIASYQTRHERSHRLAIQITTDMPMWGGLSGCTLEEGQSWGKINAEADKAVCHADATIALPIIIHSLSERFRKVHRRVPVFQWRENDFSLKFRTRVD